MRLANSPLHMPATRTPSTATSSSPTRMPQTCAQNPSVTFLTKTRSGSFMSSGPCGTPFPTQTLSPIIAVPIGILYSITSPSLFWAFFSGSGSSILFLLAGTSTFDILRPFSWGDSAGDNNTAYDILSDLSSTSESELASSKKRRASSSGGRSLKETRLPIFAEPA